MDKAKQEQQRMYPGVYRQQNLLNSNEVYIYSCSIREFYLDS